MYSHSQAGRASLDGEHFDVIVIGGGINGVAIARQAARHGQRTLLLEQHDFGAGTTSRSTRIIHGGLRYLEHGELGLVRQSLRERQRLLCERPHLVRPLNFVLALPRWQRPRGRSALEIRLGLWLYSKLAGPRAASSPDVATLERWLDAGGQWSTFSYEDAQCEFPERLVAEWLREAAQAGATVRNYAEALEVRIWDGIARGVVVRDRLRSDEASVSANWIINASGPWVDRMCARAGLVTKTPMVGGVRGSHIVLPNFAGAPAALYTEAGDGRPVFLVPWNGQLLVGTTEVPDDGDPGRTAPSAAEIDYLIRSVNRLFPRADIHHADVRYAFAGVRPLPFAPDQPPSAVTRRHLLHNHQADGATGMISVIGGKLTTAAALARDCARLMGISVPEPRAALLTGAACEGMENSLEQWAGTVAARADTSEASARAIAEWHGRGALAVCGIARQLPAARARLCQHTPHLVAEAVAAVRSEHAVTLSDILLRRVPVALGACWSPECSRNAAQRIGAALGWTDSQTAMELERFAAERDQFLHPQLPTIRSEPATLERLA